MASSTKDGSEHWELRYRHLVEAIEDPIVSTDAQGRIVEWNPAAAALFGFYPHEALGSLLSDVIGLTHFPSDRFEEEVTLRRKDGSRLLCEVSAWVRGEVSAERTATFIVRDISDAKRTGNLMRAQRNLALGLTEVDTLEHGLRLCCETVIEVSEMDCGGVYLVDEKDGCLRPVFHKGVASDLAETMFDDVDSARTRFAKAGSPVYAGREEMGALFQGAARQEGLRAFAIVPIRVENRHIGCLWIASHQIDSVPPFARDAVRRLANLTGVVIARLKAKLALHDSQERLQLAQKAGNVAVFDWDLRTDEVVWTPKTEWASGSSGYASEDTYEALKRRIHPEDMVRLEALFKEWISSGRGEEWFEYRIFRPDGEMRWKLSRALLVRSADGGALRMIGTSVDITGRKRTENLLNGERNLARGLSRAGTIEEGLRLCTAAAVEASEMDCGWVYLVDWAAGTLTLVFHQGMPPALLERVAYQGLAFVSEHLMRVKPRFLRRGELEMLPGEQGGAGGLQSLAAVSIWSGNRIVACLNLGSFRFDDVPPFARLAIERMAGQTGTYVVGLNAESSLRESEEKYRRLFEDSSDAIFIASPDGKIRECNKAFCDLLGYTRDEAVGLHTGEVFSRPGHRIGLLEEIERTGSVKDFELKLRRKDGVGALGLVNAARKCSQEGQVIGYEGIIRDVTERRRLELEVLRISGIERREIGQDLHDNIGQQLTGIALKAKSLAQVLARKSLAEAGDAAKLADLVNQAIGQVRDLAKGLVLVDLEAGGICTAIRELAGRMREIRGVSCKVFFTPDTIRVNGMTGPQLYRIAQEAVMNAYRHSNAKHIEIHLTQADGATTLRVQDDGIGISTISERNNGLGLHLMKYRAELVNGSLEVKNGPNGGTVVECVIGESRASCVECDDNIESTEAYGKHDKDIDRR